MKYLEYFIVYAEDTFLININYRLQSIYNHMIGRAASVVSSLLFHTPLLNLKDRSISHVMAVKSEHTKLVVVPQPKSWFKLQSHVTDSFPSRTLLCKGRKHFVGGHFQELVWSKVRYVSTLHAGTTEKVISQLVSCHI